MASRKGRFSHILRLFEGVTGNLITLSYLHLAPFELASHVAEVYHMRVVTALFPKWPIGLREKACKMTQKLLAAELI